MLNELLLLEKLAKLDLFIDFAESGDENKNMLKKIVPFLIEKKFNQNEAIIIEGDVGDCLYILMNGDVRVLRKTPQNEQFAVVNLSAQFNVFFGEIALIDNDRRSATVVAITDCDTVMLTQADFFKLCEENPLLGYKICLRIAKRISATLRKANDDATTLYQALIDEIDT